MHSDGQRPYSMGLVNKAHSLRTSYIADLWLDGCEVLREVAVYLAVYVERCMLNGTLSALKVHLKSNGFGLHFERKTF